MLKSFLISSGVFPLIMLATVLQPTSLSRISGMSSCTTHKHRQERLDIEVVCSQDNLEKHFLVNSDELLIPLANVSGALAGLIL